MDSLPREGLPHAPKPGGVLAEFFQKPLTLGYSWAWVSSALAPFVTGTPMLCVRVYI